MVENGNLNIYDRASSGGALLRSTPTDLYEPTTDNDFLHIFDGWKDLAKDNGLGAIALAWTPDGFFMAGLFKDGNTFDGSLYKLPADGSCAQLSCSEWGIPLPTTTTEQGQPESGLINTSALATGTIGTRPVLAVGLTTANEGFHSGVPNPMPGGIYLVDANNGSVISTYQDEFPTAPVQTVVTALDWDDNGSGLLAVGAMSEEPHKNLHAVRVSADGTFSNGTNWEDPLLASPVPLAVAVGHRADGSPVFAYGMSDGGVKLWDPALTSTTLLSQFTGPGDADAVDALTFTDRIDGTVGVPDLVAVSNRGNSARVLRYSGATTLTPLAVAPQGGTSTDVGGIRAWFPGYKTGTLTFANFDSESEIQLDFATRPNAAYGCWFLQGPPPVGSTLPGLPTTPVVLDKLSSTGWPPGFLFSATATFTAGEGGDCAATDFTGQWAAYVVATPLDRPADRTVAKLVWSRSGELTVQSVGGSLTLQPNLNVNDLGLGRWEDRHPLPPPPGTPTSLKVTGKRLDPAGTTRPVYRFDVAATTWPLPASTPPRKQTVLPPLRVHGTTSTGENVDLGLLVPQGPPSRATSGSVTLSPVSFYWQNPAAGQQITDVWVDVGPGSRSSNVVDIPSLAAPPVGTTVGQLVVCPATGTSTGSCGANADPVANGLDQAPLRIQVYDGDNQVLPVTDPVYGQIYYRDEDGDLLTGLIPADGSAYIRVSPYAGAYPNDGSTHAHPAPGQCPSGRTVRLPVHHLHRRAGDHRPRRWLAVGERPEHRRRRHVHPPGATRRPGRLRVLRQRLQRRLHRHQLLPARPDHPHRTRAVPHHRPRHQRAAHRPAIRHHRPHLTHQPAVAAGRRPARAHRRCQPAHHQQRRGPPQHHLRVPARRRHRHLARHPRHPTPRPSHQSRRRQLATCPGLAS